MAQAGSSQGLRLPVSGRGQGSGIFSVGEAETSSRKSIPVGRSFPTRPSFFRMLTGSTITQRWLVRNRTCLAANSVMEIKGLFFLKEEIKGSTQR